MEDSFCLTCCFGYDAGKSYDENEDAHQAHDGAHYPVWSEEPSEEKSIMEALENGSW